MVSLDQPPADVDRGAADQAHGAVNDDGVGLVALDHADVEEPGIFAVHGVVHDACARRRDDPAAPAPGRPSDRRTQGPRSFSQSGSHHIVGVDDADDLGIGGGVCKRKAQRARLEAGEIIGIDEFEALAERAAMILDRQPERRIGRVVDDDDAFEIRVVEPGDRIERLLEHLRRLAIGRNVDRDFRCDSRRARAGGARDQPARLAAEGDGRDFLDARERDRRPAGSAGRCRARARKRRRARNSGRLQ